MDYFTLGDMPVFHALAQDFLICDRWFSSVPGPTWPNRFFVHSGTSLGHTDMPEGFDPGLHVYSQPTVYERLEEAGISWRIYVGDFAQSWLMTAQWEYGFRYAWMSQFFSDAAGDPGNFPAYTFVEPSYFGARENDKHPPHDIMLGEALLARVYNALRANEELWRSTLLVVLTRSTAASTIISIPPRPILGVNLQLHLIPIPTASDSIHSGCACPHSSSPRGSMQV
jgi:phospholipase C